MSNIKLLTEEESDKLIQILQQRFEKNMHRHAHIKWEDVSEILNSDAIKLWSLHRMEETGGEPDVVVLDPDSSTICYVDCSAESPKGRRSCCYDQLALDTRKEHKPKISAEGMAEDFFISILTEEEFKTLQAIEKFDLKTSSWLKTPEEVRKLGGAIFGDRRYDRVFTYHNGAESYYAARGFRAKLLLDSEL